MSATTAGLLQLGLLLVALAAVYVPFGDYMARVFTGDGRTGGWSGPCTGSSRVDPDSEQRWTGYAAALLAFSFLSASCCSTCCSGPGAAAAEPGLAARSTPAHGVQHRGRRS